MSTLCGCIALTPYFHPQYQLSAAASHSHLTFTVKVNSHGCIAPTPNFHCQRQLSAAASHPHPTFTATPTLRGCSARTTNLHCQCQLSAAASHAQPTFTVNVNQPRPNHPSINLTHSDPTSTDTEATLNCGPLLLFKSLSTSRSNQTPPHPLHSRQSHCSRSKMPTFSQRQSPRFRPAPNDASNSSSPPPGHLLRPPHLQQ